jgi:ribosomal protein L39E
MSLAWYSQDGRFPPQDEIKAMSWGTGEKLAVQLFQIARDAKENARAPNWYVIKTNVKITPIAWSDVLAVVIYILVLRQGCFGTFSWDQIDVMVLSAGRSRDKASEIQAIELALRRFEQSCGVTSGEANWRTNIAKTR